MTYHAMQTTVYLHFGAAALCGASVDGGW